MSHGKKGRPQEDLTGRIFGSLTVLSCLGRDLENRHSVWRCRCTCGAVCERTNRYLKESTRCVCPACDKAIPRRQKPVDENNGRRADIAGRRYGRLTAIERIDIRKHHAIWRCLCDCGNIVDVDIALLTAGRTRSCGCLRKAFAVELGHVAKTHGASTTRLYNIWARMKQRCYNENDRDHYKNYGARGIRICDAWRNSFESFRDWALANGYNDTLTIDRIDNDGNYEPTNCRWTDSVGQREHVRRRVSKFTNERTDYKAIAEATGINKATLLNRIRRGMSLVDAIAKEK